MANGNYSYNGEVISEEQLAGIANRRGLSLDQLLEVEPEIKTTIKPLSQQELMSARFSFDGTEYDLGDISKTAEHYNLSVEDFLIKHKDKITTTSRIGSFLGLSDPDFLKGSKHDREETLKKFESDYKKEGDEKIDYAPLFLAPAGTTGVNTPVNFERLSIEGEAVDNFISDKNLEELNNTFSDEKITFKRFNAGKKYGTKGNIVVKLPWMDSSRAFPIPKEDGGLNKLKWQMANYISSNPSDKVIGISKHLSDEIDAIWDRHSGKWNAEKFMKDELGELLGDDYILKTAGTLGNEFIVEKKNDGSKINIKVGGSKKLGWADTSDELKRFILTKTYNFEDSSEYKKERNEIVELVRSHYLENPVNLNDIFETAGITDFSFKATAKNKEILMDVVISDIADGEGAWLNNARSNFDNLTSWDIDQIVRGVIGADIYDDWRELAGQWSNKEIDEQIAMLTTTKGYSHSQAGDEIHNTFVGQHTANFNNYEVPITAKLLEIDALTRGVEEDEWDTDKIKTLNDELAVLVQNYQRTANYDVIFDMRTKGLAPGIADPKSPHINITDDVFETMGNYAGFSREKLRVEFINTAAALKEWEDITRNLTRKVSLYGMPTQSEVPFTLYDYSGSSVGPLVQKLDVFGMRKGMFQHDEWDVLIEQKIELVKKMEALKRTYLLNERLETIDKSDWGGRWEQAIQTFTSQFSENENTRIVNRGLTEAQVVDATKDLYHEMNIPLSRAAKEHSKTNTGDMIMQGVGGLPWVVGEFYGWGKLVNAGKYLLGINKWVQALGKERYIRNNVVLSEKTVIKEANRWASRQYGLNTTNLSQADIIGLYIAEGTGFRIGAKVPKGIQLVGPTLFNRGVITGVGMLSEGLVFSGVEGSWEGMPKGMGFSLIGQGIPASLKTTAVYLNTLYKLSAGGVKMAGGNQVGTAFNGLVNDLMGHEDWQVFLKNNYDDPDAWLGHVITDLILGAGLSVTHMTKLDIQSHDRVKESMGEYIKKKRKYEEVDKHGKPRIKKGEEENWNKWNDLYKRAQRRVYENEGMEDFLNPIKLAALAYKETEAAEPDYIANGYNGVDLILRKPDKGEREGEFKINKQTNRVEIRMDPESITPGLLSHEMHHPLFMMLMADKPTKAATIKTLLDLTKKIMLREDYSLYDAIRKHGVEASAIEGMDLAKVREAELFAFISQQLRNGKYIDGIKSSNGWWALKKWIQGDTKAIVENRTMNDIINWFGKYHENIGAGKSNLAHFEKLAELIENMEPGAEPGAYPQVGEFYPTSPLIEGPEFSKGGYVHFPRYMSHVPMGSERLIDSKGIPIEIRISTEEEENFNKELQKAVVKPVDPKDAEKIKKLKNLDTSNLSPKMKEKLETDILNLEAGADVYKVVEMYDPAISKTAGTGRVINKMASYRRWFQSFKKEYEWDAMKDDILRDFLTGHRGIKGLTAEYNRQVKNKDINPETFSLGDFIGGKFDVRFADSYKKISKKRGWEKSLDAETAAELVAPKDRLMEELETKDFSPKARMERKRWLEERGLTEETAESYIAEKNLITLSKALGLRDAKNIVKKAQKTIPELERNLALKLEPKRPGESKKEYSKRKKEYNNKIVSHKNAVNQYRKSIEKDIVVGFFGVSENTYNKMSTVGKKGQALKTARAWQIKGTKEKPGDLQAVKKVIEAKNEDGSYKNVPTILTAISKGHQHKIDPVDLTEVAPDIVKGKSAGVPRVLLWNELLFTPTSKRQQTEAGLEPFIQSESFIEYQKSTDPIYRAEFEQKFVESLKTPQDYKAVMQEVGKNIYLQSVRVALPVTSALARQLEAGKNEGLASTRLLYKKIIEDLKNKGVPTLGDLHTILYSDKYKKWDDKIKNAILETHKADFDRLNKDILTEIIKDKADKLLEGEEWGELMKGGRLKPGIEMKTIETTNHETMIPDLVGRYGGEGELFEGIKYEGVNDWTKDAKKVAAYNKFEAYRCAFYPDGKKIQSLLRKDMSNGQNLKWIHIEGHKDGGRYELIKYKKGDKKTMQNWFTQNLDGETYRHNGKHIDDGRINEKTGEFEYDYWFLRDAVPVDSGKAKTDLAYEITYAISQGATYRELLKLSRDRGWEITTGKKDPTWEDFMHVIKANSAKRRFWIKSHMHAIENHADYGVTLQEAVMCAIRHIRRHTNINDGSFKGTATMTAGSIEVGEMVGKKPESETWFGTMYHAEHLFMTQNYSYTTWDSMARNWNPRGTLLRKWGEDWTHKGSFDDVKFDKEMDILDEQFEQAIPVKQDQLIYDSPLFGGNTKFNKDFKGKKLGEVSSILNILYRPGMAGSLSNWKSKTPQSIEESILKDYNRNQLDILLKLALSKGGGKQNALHRSLSQKNQKKNRDAMGSTRIERARIMDKALAEGRKKNKKKKSGSFFDADDTLFRSKSGVRYSLPNPNYKNQPSWSHFVHKESAKIHEKATKRKVIFMAGSAGAGKSSVIKELGLKKIGFKIVNQDIALEWLMKNHGMPKDMRDFTSEQMSQFGKLAHESRLIAANKKIKYQGRGDGVIIDGTGSSRTGMAEHVKQFQDKGYDVGMVFVETSKDVAIARNRARKERSLKTSIVETTWEHVMSNKKSFKKLFGETFSEVNTDNIKQNMYLLPRTLTDVVHKFVAGHFKGRLNPGEYAGRGSKLKEQGAEFDFKEFDKIVEGETGFLFPKALAKAKKYGNKDIFIITARPPKAAKPIHEFLKSQGLDIPLENIYALGNSTAEAKAFKIVEKIAEGYNDIYFADDALQNIKAVKNVMDQFDVKGKVQQSLGSTKITDDINKIMEHSLGVAAKKRFSKAEAQARGKDIKRRRIIMPDANADLELLIEPLLGKGKEGIKNRKWFEKNFFKPWERGINDLNTSRQTILNDYKNLRKQNKDVVKSFDKAVEGTHFTNDQAMRVYIWNKNGFKIPDLAKTTEAKLVRHVKSNPKLQVFADNVAVLTKIETGLKKPSTEWMAQTIASEVSKTGRTIERNKYLAEWIEAKNIIFSKENLNKMESRLGTRWREDIEDMFDRMETGRTRSLRMGRMGNAIMDYLNGAVGATMSLNMRSGVLQSISSVNFLNFSDNSVFMAGKAFANAPQYWKDFKYILNSDMLVQRREGLKINVNEAELAAVAAEGKNAYQRVLAWTLKQGFLPTKIVDSFAIAAGGSTFYRNRINTYLKEGFSKKEAESKAWLDFQSIAEKTQQSSRPDLLSRQQTSFEGRLILPYANTPIQMNRIMLKEILDISKGRYKGYFGEGSLTHKLSKITYFGAVQSIIFATLQSGLFALMVHGDDDDDFDDVIVKKKIRTINTVTDSFLRGMGVQGAVVAGFKNAILEFLYQQDKGKKADYTEVAEDLLNISPTIGSKYSGLDAAGNTYLWNQKEIHEKGFSLDNTKGIEAVGQTVQAILNWPTYRAVRKTENIQGALNEQNAAWQRFWMFGGWGSWDVGVERKKKKKKSIPGKRYKRKVY